MAPVEVHERQPTTPETLVSIGNDVLSMTFSSHGGALNSVVLKQYYFALDPNQGPLTILFTNNPALQIMGIPGLERADDYELLISDSRTSVMTRARTADGVNYERVAALRPDYHLLIMETFSNAAAHPVAIPRHSIQLGAMRLGASTSIQRGMGYLGVDTLASQGGEKVRHWGTKKFLGGGLTLSELFQPKHRQGAGCIKSMFMGKITTPLPYTIQETIEKPVDWVAVKNKFFCQILSYSDSAAGFNIQATRLLSPGGEDPNNSASWMGTAVLDQVSGGVLVNGFVLSPGEVARREATYYVGPKKLELLEQLSGHQEDVMEFGRLKFIAVILLRLLNFIHGIVPNYGVAIILLTVIIKVVFWPVTHKSTEQMKRMAELQPEVTALREKFKDKPEKIQKELMALYKENKVNPMMGCVPLLVQIPVFIGLFTMLRSAVELRYASFLWINDLSEPEGLFSAFFASIPFIPSLNILPLFMTATTFLQQKLTPTAADPQQQKIMMIMPFFFLFILYNMASGLVLYWSVTQMLAIIQLLIQRKRRKIKKETA